MIPIFEYLVRTKNEDLCNNCKMECTCKIPNDYAIEKYPPGLEEDLYCIKTLGEFKEMYCKLVNDCSTKNEKIIKANKLCLKYNMLCDYGCMYCDYQFDNNEWDVSDCHCYKYQSCFYKLKNKECYKCENIVCENKLTCDDKRKYYYLIGYLTDIDGEYKIDMFEFRKKNLIIIES